MGLLHANWAYIRHVYETAWEHHHLQSFKFSKLLLMLYVSISLSLSRYIYISVYILILPMFIIICCWMQNTSRRVLKKYSAPLGAQTSDPVLDSHQQKWNHHQNQCWGQIAGRHNEPLIAGFISKTHSLSPWDAEYFQLLLKPCILEIKINNCKLVFSLHCRNSAGIWSQITGMLKFHYVKSGRYLSTLSLLILENIHASTHNSYSMLFLKPKQLVKIVFVMLTTASQNTFKIPQYHTIKTNLFFSDIKQMSI